MVGELTQKFCRECYTTTTHKTILVKNPNSGKRNTKTVCLKCLKVRKEQVKPIKEYEKELKIL